MKSSVFAHEAEMVCHNLAHEVFGFCRDVSHGRRGKVARLHRQIALADCIDKLQLPTPSTRHDAGQTFDVVPNCLLLFVK